MRNINLRYCEETYDEQGVLTDFKVKCPDTFNFGYDVVDDIAENDPDRRAMMWCNPEGEEHLFTFADMKRWSDKTANYLAAHGVGKGDMVMVILRRHYQFWFVATALAKLGAVMVPATFMLKEHDLEYRLNGASIKAVICTSIGTIAQVVDDVVDRCPSVEHLFLVNGAGGGLTEQDADGNWLAVDGPVGAVLSGPEGVCAVPGKREGWHDFNTGVRDACEEFSRVETHVGDPMLMYFSSGTSGNPKMVLHDSYYALAHLVTAKHWHNVKPDGLHLTIADTGWGKAVWGKYYGQWLMEACVLTYDFDRFHADEILDLIPRYGVTTLCCPPTMYGMMMQADVDAHDLSTLTYCTTAGEALNPDLFDFWKEHTGLTIFEGFGQTETPLTVANLTHAVPKPGSMGHPSPAFTIEVQRGDGSRCDVGETGEICIDVHEKAPGIMLEYYRNPEKTEAAVYDGWYRHRRHRLGRRGRVPVVCRPQRRRHQVVGISRSAPLRSKACCSSMRPCASAPSPACPTPCAARRSRPPWCSRKVSRVPRCSCASCSNGSSSALRRTNIPASWSSSMRFPRPRPTARSAERPSARPTRARKARRRLRCPRAWCKAV